MAKKKILPPVYFFTYIILIAILHFIFPIKRVIYFPYNLSGIVLIIVGLAIVMYSGYLFNKFHTAIKPFQKSSKLITTGPYKYSRNPMYLWGVIALLGEAVIFGSLSCFIVPILAFFTLQILFIPHEERMMLEVFGEEFEDYKGKVRRWF